MYSTVFDSQTPRINFGIPGGAAHWRAPRSDRGCEDARTQRGRVIEREPTAVLSDLTQEAAAHPQQQAAAHPPGCHPPRRLRLFRACAHGGNINEATILIRRPLNFVF